MDAAESMNVTDFEEDDANTETSADCAARGVRSAGTINNTPHPHLALTVHQHRLGRRYATATSQAIRQRNCRLLGLLFYLGLTHRDPKPNLLLQQMLQQKPNILLQHMIRQISMSILQQVIQ